MRCLTGFLNIYEPLSGKRGLQGVTVRPAWVQLWERLWRTQKNLSLFRYWFQTPPPWNGPIGVVFPYFLQLVHINIGETNDKNGNIDIIYISIFYLHNEIRKINKSFEWFEKLRLDLNSFHILLVKQKCGNEIGEKWKIRDL